MCAEAGTGAELDILGASERPRPILSLQTPYVFFEFSGPKPDHFTFTAPMAACSTTQYASISQCNRKRCRPFNEYDESERPDKRRRLRLQIAFSRLSSPYSFPSSPNGFTSYEAIISKPSFIARSKMPKLKGDLIRKTAILNKIRRDGLARIQDASIAAEDRKAEVLRRHRLLFESYQSDPLRNPPPSAEVLESRWEADEIHRFEEDEGDDDEECGWTFFV